MRNFYGLTSTRRGTLRKEFPKILQSSPHNELRTSNSQNNSPPAWIEPRTPNIFPQEPGANRGLLRTVSLFRKVCCGIDKTNNLDDVNQRLDVLFNCICSAKFPIWVSLAFKVKLCLKFVAKCNNCR